MNLPTSLRNRAVFTLAGVLLGGAYAAADIFLFSAYPEDHVPLAVGACIGGGLAALTLWPSGQRSGRKMIMLGALVVLLAIWASQFSVGFFSEREIAARERGLDVWVGSFFGSLFVGLFLTLFTLLKTLVTPIILGLFVGGAFRDDVAE